VLALAIAWQRTAFSTAALEVHAIRHCTYHYSRTLIALAWASGLLLLLRAGRLPRLSAALGAVGRMAFSNYVLQTVCCTLLFFGYGLSLYGSLSRAQTMLVVLAVTAVQVAFSLAWLAFFRFGPLEWAWRSLTYWRLQPIRRG
jgi:uncharacterized protein